MTGREHPQIVEDADKKGQSHSGQKAAAPDNVFSSKDEMEAEEHKANMEDKNIRTLITRDVRPMRWAAVLFAITLPMLLLVLLYIKIEFYLKLDSGAVEAMATPMTALIIGTFVCVTAIYSALLLGLFRSVSESRDKLTMADAYPLIALLRKANITGGG